MEAILALFGFSMAICVPVTLMIVVVLWALGKFT
jgi:hypothetical protein